MTWARTDLGLYLPDGYGQNYVDTTNGSPTPPGLTGRAPVGVSLFTGAGGMDLGFTQAGFHVAVATDNWAEAAVTYMCNMARYGQVKIIGIEDDDVERLDAHIEKAWRKNDKKRKKGILVADELAGSGWISHFPEIRGCELYYFGDVRKLTGDRILSDLGMEQGEVDVVFGGPPCQGFSTAGKRDIMDPRNSLVFDFARLVTEIMPKTMVMENVPGIASMVTPEGIPVLDALTRILEDGGFGVADALKKAMLHSSGAGAAMRGKPKPKYQPVDDDDPDAERQLSLEEVMA